MHDGHSSLSQNAYQIECNWLWTNVTDVINFVPLTYERKRMDHSSLPQTSCQIEPDCLWTNVTDVTILFASHGLS